MTKPASKTWREIQFKDFVQLQRGFDLPSQDRRDGIYPIIASTSITGYHDEYKVEPPCVTTGRSGALGEVLYVKSKCWPLNTVLWVKDFKGNNPYFVYSKLKTLHLEQYNSGAGVPTLNRNHLDQIIVDLPPLKDQATISDVLSTYDDFIENNNRRIQILEQTAQAIYTEWFVNFRFPNHEKVKKVDSGTKFGKIPEGWEVKPLGECFEITTGGIWGNDNQDHDFSVPVRCFKGSELDNLTYGKVPDLALRWIKPSQQADRELKEGDIIVEGSGSYCGRSLLITDDLLALYEESFTYSNFCKRLKSRSDIRLSYLLKYYLLALYSSGAIKNYRIGAAFPNFDLKGLLTDSFFVVPNKKVVASFVDIVKQLMGLGINLADTNRKLYSTRDLLLPKLVTGEIKV